MIDALSTTRAQRAELADKFRINYDSAWSIVTVKPTQVHPTMKAAGTTGTPPPDRLHTRKSLVTMKLSCRTNNRNLRGRAIQGQICREQLAYLSENQNITAATVNSNIENALTQLRQLRQDLAAVRNEHRAQAVLTALQSMQWLEGKIAKLCSTRC